MTAGGRGAGAPYIDFIATLPTGSLYPQQLLWSRQIEIRMPGLSLLSFDLPPQMTAVPGKALSTHGAEGAL
jgi:hypothetical protein